VHQVEAGSLCLLRCSLWQRQKVYTVPAHENIPPRPPHDNFLIGLKVFTPEKAGEPAFLEELSALKPDLCVTAAYGNFLPSKFLAIPKFGTLNIHPSLLPKYRGAAPVPRCLENGDSNTGVSVLFTGPKSFSFARRKECSRRLFTIFLFLTSFYFVKSIIYTIIFPFRFSFEDGCRPASQSDRAYSPGR
jgi:hypothetical protein